MEINAITPPTVGWLEGKLDENAVEYLWKCIDNKEGSEKRNLEIDWHIQKVLI